MKNKLAMLGTGLFAMASPMFAQGTQLPLGLPITIWQRHTSQWASPPAFAALVKPKPSRHPRKQWLAIPEPLPLSVSLLFSGLC